MADLGAHLSQRGTLVDTNNDGIADGFAHTVKNAGNFSTFSLTNGVLSLAPTSSGASIGGANTQVQFNDAALGPTNTTDDTIPKAFICKTEPGSRKKPILSTQAVIKSYENPSLKQTKIRIAHGVAIVLRHPI